MVFWDVLKVHSFIFNPYLSKNAFTLFDSLRSEFVTVKGIRSNQLKVDRVVIIVFRYGKKPTLKGVGVLNQMLDDFRC